MRACSNLLSSGRPVWKRIFSFTLACMALSMLSFAPRLNAQAISGIVGTVTDQSGAVVPDAGVTATNNATGVTTKTATTSSGNYSFTDLTPGVYTVSVEKSGFQKGVISGVVVEVSRKSTANAVLSAGKLEQTVEVTSSAITLETEQPELGTTIDSKVLQELPAAIGGGAGDRGRQIDEFLFLTPGVTGGAFSHRINGGVDFQNEVLFNGVAAAQSETQGYQSNINPPYEMVSEFRVLSSVFSAQYGLAQGVASYQFASGTNHLHGDAFEILRNDFFDAKGANPPTDASGHPRTPVDKHHNYGFSVGGPVFIPKIYDGRNKTFFHVSSEWYRLNRGVTGNLSVPTAAEKGGDFSAFPNPIYIPINFVPPAGCTPGAANGQQWPGNKIPTSCFSTISSGLLTLLPDPTRSGFINNLPSQITNIPTRQTSWGFSIDHSITESQKIHGSYWRDIWNEPYCCDNGALFTNELSGLKTEPRLGTGLFLTYSNTFTPHLVMTAGLGWMGEINDEFNTHPGFNFPGVAGSTSFPTIHFGGGDSNKPTDWGAGAGGETFSINRKLGISFDNNWLYSHGRHTLNFGLEIRRLFQDDHECQQCGGSLTFSSRTTSNGSNFTGTGSAFASFLLGEVDSASRQFALETRLRNFYVAPYIQDDFKLTPKLTIDAGLRWEIMVPFHAVDQNIVFFDPSLPNPGAINPATGQPLLGAASQLGTCAGCSGYDRASIRWGNISPRLGFDYQLNNRTVIMAGYALNRLDGGPFEFGNNKVAVQYGNVLAGIYQANSLGGSTPGYGQWDNNPVPNISATPFTPIIGNGTGSIHQFSRDPGATPYIEAWNAGIQRELPWNMLLSASYVGNRALHLPSMLNPPNQLNPQYLTQFCPSGDPADPNCLVSPASGQTWTTPAGQAALQGLGFGLATTTCPDGTTGTFYAPYGNFLCDYGSGASLTQALLPYPMYNASGSCGGLCNNFDMSGVSLYNALQLQGQKRFTNGLSFLVNYTLSRNMSNTDSGFSSFNWGALNKYNQKAEWSIASNDQTHVINISGVYELPIGPGKKHLNGGGTLAKNLIGGWQLSGLFSYASGTPMSIMSFNEDPFGNGFNRANYSGAPLNVNLNNYYKNLPVFNTGAFSDPGYQAGNAPRNISGLRNSWADNENLALAKKFFFGEQVQAELRMEFFNIFNRVQLCGPDTDVNSGTFGLINGPCQANTPRQGQAYFRISF